MEKGSELTCQRAESVTDLLWVILNFRYSIVLKYSQTISDSQPLCNLKLFLRHKWFQKNIYFNLYCKR